MSILTKQDNIKVIVKILKDNETKLTDGYDNYCGYDEDGNEGDVNKVLEKISLDIIKALNLV